MTRANLTRFALTAPEDKAIFARISDAYANFEAWTAELNEKKIDVQHEIAVHGRLREMEAERIRDDAALRAQRIYFRVLLLALLDAEDVWKDEQAAKARAKREKENA